LLSVSHYHQRAGVHPAPVHFVRRQQCIEIVTAGRGWVEIGGRWQEVTSGDLLWHKAGDCTIGRSDFANPYRCLAVRILVASGVDRPVPRHTRWEEVDEVLQFTNQVVALHADDAFDSHVLLSYILSRVQFQAELYQRAQRERGLPPELQQVIEVINRRFAEPLRLADLAAAAGWSVPHLHDRFRKRLGVSPHQALIRRRIQFARELLASTNDPVKSIAARCGFPNAAAFCVQFRKTTQIAPKEYRDRQLYGSKRL
jgi:AraC-like DNA-binding protein